MSMRSEISHIFLKSWSKVGTEGKVDWNACKLSMITEGKENRQSPVLNDMLMIPLENWRKKEDCIESWMMCQWYMLKAGV